jgi:hypothetical protein
LILWYQYQHSLNQNSKYADVRRLLSSAFNVGKSRLDV